MNASDRRYPEEAPPSWPPQPPSMEDSHSHSHSHSLRRLQQLARGEILPPTRTPPPQQQSYVDPFLLPPAGQSLEDAFFKLDIRSADDYHHHHQYRSSEYHPHRQPPNWSNYTNYQSPTSRRTGNGWGAPSDTYDLEWFTSDPYLSYGHNEQSLVMNSSPLTPTYANSNASSSNSFGDSSVGLNGTVSQNFDTSISNVGYRQHYYKPQENRSFVPVEQLRGNIMHMAKNQNGCRILQNTMECLTHAYEIEMILDEVIGNISDLMVDQFGNYVVQKLVELCNEVQRTRIIAYLTMTEYSLISICLNTHGTRVVQKLLEHVTSRLQVDLFMQAVSPHAVALCKSPNGQHVIQYCVKHFSAADTAYLLDEVACNLVEVATSKSGCCVLQQCVEFSRGYIRERLVKGITANAVLLSEDRYGNYVVQHLLSMKIQGITTLLLIYLSGNHMSLSTTKYGSNVVERSLRESNEVQASGIIRELLNNPSVPSLLTDEFGNYVIQTALTVSKGDSWMALKDLVERNLRSMRSNLYGKKVLGWFDKNNIPLNPDKCTSQVRGKKTG